MANRSRHQSIVVCDDDPLIRLVLRGALEREGYAVAEAENGATAVERAQMHDVCAVIVDARMPGLTLAETLAALRSERSDLPILVLSGQPEAPAEVDAPHIQFLSKPVDTQLFLDTVRALVGQPGDSACQEAVDHV